MMYDISQESNLLDCIERKASPNKISSFWLGMQQYDKIWDLQKELHKNIVDQKMGDVLLLLEHPHVYTLGKNADSNHLLPSYPKDADVINIDRGGDITYHGPGQLVGYPIINLKRYKKSVSWYMHSLEAMIIKTLDEIGISSSRRDELTGVWVEDDKICAFGVRMAKWTTMHGFALNFNPDMKFFNGIIPCGIFEYGVISIHELLDVKFSIKELANKVSTNCNEYFRNNILEQDFA
tara:strand:- start:406 stop:1113 length:708 start_codon:yes stop_codon:yes gene_type:complete